MEIGKEAVVAINRQFGGRLIRDSSLDFALAKQESKKIGPFKKLAFLWRAILVDHPFSDGNKRTAVHLALGMADSKRKKVNGDLLVRYAVDIAKHCITNIRQIEWRLRHAIK